MSKRKDNSTLIFILSLISGVCLVVLQLLYLKGFLNTDSSIISILPSYLPSSLLLVIMSWLVGRGLYNAQYSGQLIKRHFIVIGLMCLSFFPLGLPILFTNFNFKDLNY